MGEHSLSATNLSNKNKKSRLSLSASSPINKTKSAPSPSRLPIKSSPVKPPSTAVTPSKEKESTAKAAKFGRLSLGGSLSERKAVKQKRISLAPVSGIASINYDLEISRDSKKPKIEDQSSYHPCSEDEKNTHVCINTSTTTAKSIVRTPTAAVSRRVSLAPNLLAASVKRNLRSSVSSTPASSLLKASDGGGAPGATPFVVPATTPGGRKVDSKHRASMGPRLFKALEEMKKLDAVLNDDKPFSGDQQQSRTEDEAAVVEESEAVLAAEEQAVFEELISETSVAVNDAATVAATTTIATSLESNDVGFMDDETPSFVVDCSFTAEVRHGIHFSSFLKLLTFLTCRNTHKRKGILKASLNFWKLLAPNLMMHWMWMWIAIWRCLGMVKILLTMKIIC